MHILINAQSVNLWVMGYCKIYIFCVLNLYIIVFVVWFGATTLPETERGKLNVSFVNF